MSQPAPQIIHFWLCAAKKGDNVKKSTRPVKKTRWVPYVGDDLCVAETNLLRLLPEIKPFDQLCASCGCADAPFGVGYPNAIVWFCRLHIGGSILEDIDKAKMKEVMRRCVKGAQNWLYLYEAAGRGQSAECRRLWEQIRQISVETGDILKALSEEKQS